MGEQQDDSKDYNKHVYKQMWKTFDLRTADEYAAHLLPHLQPHHHILDVGCGRGSITMDLARLVPNGKVLGVDINPSLIEAASKQAAERSITNIDFKVMDANDLSSLESESFDVIHEHQVLLYFPDQVEIVREFHRILKPGGMISLRDNAILHYWPLGKLPMMAKYLYRSLDMARANSQGEYFGVWNHVAAQQAGFDKDKIKYSSWGWSFTDPSAFVPAAKNSARAMLLAKGAMSEAELDQSEKEWETWAEVPEARMQGLDGAVIAWK